LKKLLYLEGLRGVAAIAVVLSHFIQYFYPRILNSGAVAHNDFEYWISDYPINILYNGNFSVCLFFVLSGYVLSIKFLQKNDTKILYEMAVKRYFRLAIPVSVSILLSYILVNLGWIYYENILEITKGAMSQKFELNHNFIEVIKLAFFDVFVLGDASYNSVLWTMRYELFGSFLIFIMLPLVAYNKKEYLQYILFFLLIIGIVKYVDLYIVPFILGVLLCDMHLKNRGVFKFKGKIYNTILLLIGIYLGSFPYTDTAGTIYQILELNVLGNSAFIIYHIIGAFFILIAFLNSVALQKIFSKKIFEFLGKISFSIYLIHFVLLFSFSSFLFEKLTLLNLSYNLTFILTFVPSIALMISIAYLMYLYVDSFSINFSKKVYTLFFEKMFNIFRWNNKIKK
jgi:peptidoglycan/LPS O-acetylase OafA/YrhL